MNLQSKYIQDRSGNKFAPITTPNAIRWPDGSNLNDKLSSLDAIVIEAPVDSTDPADPISALTCEFGKYYRIDVPVESLTITLPETVNDATVKSIVVFLTGGTTPSITIVPDDNETILYQSGLSDLVSDIATNDMFELNFMWNGIAWVIAGIRVIDESSNS